MSMFPRSFTQSNATGLLMALLLGACSEASEPPAMMMMPAPLPMPIPTTPAPAEAAAFELTLSADKVPVLQGTSVTVTVTATRKPGFAGAIALDATGLPAGATATPATIAAGETTIVMTVAAAATAPHSLPTPVTLRGSSGAQIVDKAVTVTVYGPPGSLDTSFVGGKAVVPVGASDDYGNAMAVQPDGKIVVAGRAAERLGDFALVRLDRDGAVDPTFGEGGKVMTDFAGGSDAIQAIALQPDGKIVVAGNAAVAGAGQDFAVARYLPDGSLDASFASGGKFTTSFGADSDMAWALLLQPDGKIVVGGDSNQGSNTSGVDFAMIRLLSDGTPDPSFGTAGKVVTNVIEGSGRDSIYGLALQNVGGEDRIIAVGGEGDFNVVRYTAAGVLDPSFGTGGKVTGVFASSIGAARAVQVTAEGNIVVAGHRGHDFALCRLTAAGVLDAGFGSAGRVVTPMSTSNWDEAQALTLQSDGKILAAGWAYEGNGSSGNFALARYSPEGQLDLGFGGTGMVFTEVATATKSDQATAVVMQVDDRVPTVRVLVGGYANGSNNDFAVTRFWR